ncbi:MAG: decaprenyl-phosphate phosphoribosyltransferase [Planctomycetota bacterium]|nr:decaprenyl-phosphate phosphoribosyltransferase [Planctomycetota bacterium]MDP6989545.1 decaprenyl-phosphate phosphoribosyltransferase [Planctomycetota bacterium]
MQEVEPNPMMALALLRAMRPHQWVKNVFVLAPLFFARAAGETWSTDYGDVHSALLALVAFVLGSSAIYLLNDLWDVESDRAHPQKRLRPIASGALPVGAARAAVAGCAALSLAAGHGAGGEPVSVAWVVLAYMALNFLYSARLKRIVLVDVFCIAAGFLLRVIAGGVAAGAQLSQWLMLCTLFLALFLALCKRRAETDLLGGERADHRATLGEGAYNVRFLDQMVTALAACTILCYAMYTVSEETVSKFGTEQLIWTVPFVVFGLARYMLLVTNERAGGSPARTLLGGDAMFVGNCLAWLVCVAVLLLGKGSPAGG